MALNTVSQVEIWEINEEGFPVIKEKLLVKSHKEWSAFVVLEFQGNSIVVKGSDLRKAVDNAVNM